MPHGIQERDSQETMHAHPPVFKFVLLFHWHCKWSHKNSNELQVQALFYISIVSKEHLYIWQTLLFKVTHNPRHRRSRRSLVSCEDITNDFFFGRHTDRGGHKQIRKVTFSPMGKQQHWVIVLTNAINRSKGEMQRWKRRPKTPEHLFLSAEFVMVIYLCLICNHGKEPVQLRLTLTHSWGDSTPPVFFLIIFNITDQAGFYLNKYHNPRTDSERRMCETSHCWTLLSSQVSCCLYAGNWLIKATRFNIELHSLGLLAKWMNEWIDENDVQPLDTQLLRPHRLVPFNPYRYSYMEGGQPWSNSHEQQQWRWIRTVCLVLLRQSFGLASATVSHWWASRGSK